LRQQLEEADNAVAQAAARGQTAIMVTKDQRTQTKKQRQDSAEVSDNLSLCRTFESKK